MTDEQQLQQDIIQCTGSSLVPQGDMRVFKQKLAQYINSLINHDFHTLISILYRLDINEKKLKELLAAQPAADAGELIAGMIIDRQLQKVKLRKQFTQNQGPIADEDKW